MSIAASKEQLIEQLKAELRQAKADFKAGKGIPLKDFDWGLPMHVAESHSEYHASEA